MPEKDINVSALEGYSETLSRILEQTAANMNATSKCVGAGHYSDQYSNWSNRYRGTPEGYSCDQSQMGRYKKEKAALRFYAAAEMTFVRPKAKERLYKVHP